MLVDASIADELAGHLAAAAEAHVVDDPQDPGTTMGSLIEESALTRVSGYVDDAISDIDDALRLARSVRAGAISVNSYSEGDITTPFGGYKQSGFGGRDNGLEAFAQYTETKTIFINLH
ncbi:aldehyde dehydrogenase family protein [Kocuria sp. 2SI]|uniref:aldehyde dehydrogenase family protein n=1 Tax=Kocuria sp. 2SI TaxID=2502203 RepID=UPI0010F451F7